MRLLSLEEKHDTTLEIINNIVGELQYIKKSGINEPENKKVYESNGGNGYITEFDDKKVLVSEGEESDEESDDESTVDESYVEGTDEGSDDSDDEGSGDSDDEGSGDSDDEVIDDIKIIKLNNDVEVLTTEVVVTKEGHDDGESYEGTDYDSDRCSVQDVDVIINDGTIPDIEVQIIPEILEIHEILKIPEILEIPEVDVSNEDVDDIALDSNVDDYRKLNVQSLKSIAISKGLSVDPSKLKKKELLHLLA
jgi:hypothetical protein